MFEAFIQMCPNKNERKRTEERRKKYICMIFIGEFDEVTMALLPSALASVENLMEPRSNENKIKMKTKPKFVFCWCIPFIQWNVKSNDAKTLYSFEKNGKRMNEHQKKIWTKRIIRIYKKCVLWDNYPLKHHHSKAESLLFELFEWMFFFFCQFKFFSPFFMLFTSHTNWNA